MPWRQQDFVEDGRKKRQTMVSDKDEMMQQSQLKLRIDRLDLEESKVAA